MSAPRRALIIGASGFLGSRLLALAPRDVDLVGTGNRRPVRPGRWRDARLDVTSPSSVDALIARERPDAVIYCSYDTTVRAITVEGARDAARAAARNGAAFVLTSTDLVFDGARGNYSEADLARPLMTYGQAKLEAEGHVKVAHPEALIVRPALLVGDSGIMVRPAYECGLLMRGQTASLFTDEWRSPVHVDDAARAIWDLLIRGMTGLFHCGGPERMTRFDLGRLLCAMYRFDPALLRAASRSADRPADTSLNSRRLGDLLGWSPRALSAAARQGVLLGV